MKKILSLVIGIISISMLLGCSSEADNPASVDDTVNAATPSVSFDTSAVSYTQNATVTPLEVTATVTDGGTLSYQWCSATSTTDAGSAISGATNSSYTPSSDTVGTTYYYCIVTNTNDSVNGETTASATSEKKEITVSSEGTVNAATPSVSFDASAVSYTQNDTVTALEVTATVTDGGTLSYQWYSATSTTDAGSAISEATNSSYTPSSDTVGTTYYFCIVTNTNDSVNGETTASASSGKKEITVSSSEGTGGISVSF